MENHPDLADSFLTPETKSSVLSLDSSINATADLPLIASLAADDSSLSEFESVNDDVTTDRRGTVRWNSWKESGYGEIAKKSVLKHRLKLSSAYSKLGVQNSTEVCVLFLSHLRSLIIS